MRGVRAFTLTEMVVTVTILGILISLAAPSFYNALLSGKLRTYANDLVIAARLARSEAVKRNAAVTLCVSSNGTSCGTGNWNQGWAVLSGATVIQYYPAIANGFSITGADSLGGSVDSLVFDATGLNTTATNFVVCRSSPTVGSQERNVALTTTGRTSVTTTNNGTCP